MASPQQEAYAKQNGFPSYDAMVLWARQRQQKREPQTTTGRPAQPVRPDPRQKPQPGQPARQGGWGGVLQYIGDALGGRL